MTYSEPEFVICAECGAHVTEDQRELSHGLAETAESRELIAESRLCCEAMRHDLLDFQRSASLPRCEGSGGLAESLPTETSQAAILERIERGQRGLDGLVRRFS